MIIKLQMFEDVVVTFCSSLKSIISDTFATLSSIKEGTIEKVLQYVLPLKSIYNENSVLVLFEQEYIFEHNQGYNKKKLLKMTFVEFVIITENQ